MSFSICLLGVLSLLSPLHFSSIQAQTVADQFAEVLAGWKSMSDSEEHLSATVVETRNISGDRKSVSRFNVKKRGPFVIQQMAVDGSIYVVGPDHLFAVTKSENDAGSWRLANDAVQVDQQLVNQLWLFRKFSGFRGI